MDNKQPTERVSQIMNPLRTNFWHMANSNESCRRCVFFIEQLAKMTCFSKSGLMAALINAGLENEPSLQRYVKDIDKCYKKETQKNKAD